jgi:hypothetical protein
VLAACAQRAASSSPASPASAAAPSTAPSTLATPAPSPDEWVAIIRGAPIAVSVERALYELPGAPHFFVHVRVSAGPGARVDLRKYHQAFYPNQWGPSDETHRSVIDEMRQTFAPLDDAARARLVADARAGLLAAAPLDYYVEFNASARADVDAQARGHRYVLVVMDGELLVSDGVSATQVLPPQDDTAREITVPAPVAWHTVPDGARIVRDAP